MNRLKNIKVEEASILQRRIEKLVLNKCNTIVKTKYHPTYIEVPLNGHDPDVLDDRWTVEVNYNNSYIAVNDNETKTGLFAQGDSAKDLMYKVEKYGANNRFIDWLYDNGFDSAFNEHNYHNK